MEPVDTKQALSTEAIPQGTFMGPHLDGPEALRFLPFFPTGTNSLLSKCLTKDIWEECKDKTDRYGYSFKQAIFSGCKWPESKIGLYAGSSDSYHAFASLFDKVIRNYHEKSPKDKHISNMDYTQLKCPEFPADEDKMITSTRIRLARNLDQYPLGTAVTFLERKRIEEKIENILEKFTGELKGKYYSLSNMTDAERQQLISEHILFKGGDQYLESCGLERDWPNSRGIFCNYRKTFLVWVNEEDHLRIISMQDGSNIWQVFKRLAEATALIEKKVTFAYDEHIGYITSCPTNLGTGLRASVHIKLPKLAKNKDQLQVIADKFHVQIRGIDGEHSKAESEVFDISNLRRLGRSEVDLVQDMYDGVKAMIGAEKKLQFA